jgi:hypothetical protein
MKFDALDLIAKVWAMSAVAAPSIVTTISPNITSGYIGSPVNVIVACAAGAYASFSWGDPVTPRSKMFRLWLSCLIMGAAFTGLTSWGIEHFMKATLTDGAQAGLGAVVSWSTKFWLPWLAERLKSGDWVNLIPIFRKKSGE